MDFLQHSPAPLHSTKKKPQFASMKPLIVTLLLASSARLWSQESTPPNLLSKEAQPILQKHAVDFYRAAIAIQGDLGLSIPDERGLLRMTKRGFPYLATLINNNNLDNYALSSGFTPETSLRTFKREEQIVGDLLGLAMIDKLTANGNVCFQLLKHLAPTPQAMKFEHQAKELSATTQVSTEIEFLQKLESIRNLFDQLKDLPQLTAEQLQKERAESAVLAPKEYGLAQNVPEPRSESEWAGRQLKWHQDFNHEGFILAFSELADAHSYLQYGMVVNQLGVIFEWNWSYGTFFYPPSYETKLTDNEFHGLKEYLMANSDAGNNGNRFVVSFLKNGRWVSRKYDALPKGCPFEGLIKRMIHQSSIGQYDENKPTFDFLNVYEDTD